MSNPKCAVVFDWAGTLALSRSHVGETTVAINENTLQLFKKAYREEKVLAAKGVA